MTQLKATTLPAPQPPRFAAAALLGFAKFCDADAPQTASLRFSLEFDVGIDCCGNLSEAEILIPKLHWFLVQYTYLIRIVFFFLCFCWLKLDQNQLKGKTNVKHTEHTS